MILVWACALSYTCCDGFVVAIVALVLFQILFDCCFVGYCLDYSLAMFSLFADCGRFGWFLLFWLFGIAVWLGLLVNSVVLIVYVLCILRWLLIVNCWHC